MSVILKQYENVYKTHPSLSNSMEEQIKYSIFCRLLCQSIVLFAITISSLPS